MGEVLRAIRLVAKGLARFLPTPHTSKLADSLKSTAETLIASIASKVRESDVQFLANALETMAMTRLGEQIYLDMMLAQLLVLLKKEPGRFSTVLMMRIQNAIGVLYQEMKLTPNSGNGTGLRFVEGMNARLCRRISEVLDEMGLLHPAYLLAFCDDAQKRLILHRCGQLQLGIRPDNRDQLPGMKKVEKAVYDHAFAFVQTLPHFTQEYLAALRAADD